MAAESKWWNSPFRVFQTNIRQIDSGLDVDKVLDHVQSLGANVWLLNTAGIVSHYPSRLPYQHPSPWLRERPSGDLVGDAISRAHERGVRVICRVDLSKVHRDVAEEHPDWCFVSPTGQPQIYQGLYSTCPSTPYYQDCSIEILREVLDNYEPDAFFFNMFKFKQTDYSGAYHGICQCGSCTRRFAERFGMALPTEHDFGDKAYRAWLEYTRDTINEVSTNIRDFVSRTRPNCAVLLKEVSDVTFREANGAVDRPQPIWIHWAGELVQDILGTTPDKPMVVNSVMFLDIPYRFMAEQREFHALHLIQSMAHGANPMAYMMGTPDLFPPAAFDLVRDVFQFHAAYEDLYAGVRPAARVGLLSSQTRDEFFGEATRATAAQKERRGVHRALLEGHVPFDIIGESLLLQTVTEDLLARFDAIVVPDYPALGAQECAALDAYVAAGGGVVTTFETAAANEDLSPRAEVGLASSGVVRILARRRGEDVRSAYVRPKPDQDDFALPNNGFIAIDKGFNIVEPAPGAHAPLVYQPASTYGPPELCYWEVETNHPGLLANSYGKGRSAYIPWPIGSLFHEWSIPEYRDLIIQAIDLVSAKPRQVVTNAPAQVEMVVSRQSEHGRTLVHLINYTGHDGRGFHPPIEVHDIRIEVSGMDVQAARSTRLDQELTVDVDDAGTATLTLPKLASFDLLVLS